MVWRAVAVLLVAALTLGAPATAQLAAIQADVAQIDVDLCGPMAPTADQHWTFVGRVTAQGHPVDQAWVSLNVDDENRHRVQTDGEGWFQAPLSFDTGEHTVEADLAARSQQLGSDGFGVVLPVSSDPVTVQAIPAEDTPAVDARPVCEIVAQPQGNSQARVYSILSGAIDPAIQLDTGANVLADVYADKACPSWGECNVDAPDTQHRGAASGIDVENGTFGLAVGPFLYDDQRAFLTHYEQCASYLKIRHGVYVEPSPGASALQTGDARENVEVCG